MADSQGPTHGEASGEAPSSPSVTGGGGEGGDRSHRAYWRSNLRLMAVLLAVWFVVPFGLGIVFVEPLNAFHLAGFPLGFWFAQQGAIYVFFVLVLIYALWMRRLDHEHGVE